MFEDLNARVDTKEGEVDMYRGGRETDGRMCSGLGRSRAEMEMC